MNRPLEDRKDCLVQQPLVNTLLGELPLRRGKVRDVYDLGESLLLVSTDRLSAFDWVFPGGIADKGRVLTQISAFWFDWLDVPDHVISTHVADFGLPGNIDQQPLVGRSMLCRKTEVIPIECVVRGYLAGSGWKEYQQHRTVCGIELPAGLRLASKLDVPVFTPATKAESGHDENISFDQMANIVGSEVAEELRRRSIDLYRRGAEYALSRGIIIADTKFEFGVVRSGSGAERGDILLIDEALTPDSSRFWPADQWEPGRNQTSFDKQFVRDYLETTDWDKNSPPPPLPDEIVAQTREKYIEAYETLTQREFPWK